MKCSPSERFGSGGGGGGIRVQQLGLTITGSLSCELKVSHGHRKQQRVTKALPVAGNSDETFQDSDYVKATVHVDRKMIGDIVRFIRNSSIENFWGTCIMLKRILVQVTEILEKEGKKRK